jgi:N-acetylglucosamine-6-sulfatase
LQPPRNKPALEKHPAGTAALSAATASSDELIRNRMRMMKAVDESTGAIVDALARQGVLDNTLVIFTSDHGYFYGEHCLGPERRLAYEEAIRIPLLVRYPRFIRAGSRPDRFVLSIDIAPTVLQMAGVAVPAGMQGRHLTTSRERDAVLIEYFSDTVFPRIRNMGYHAVRTRRWKYIHYRHLEGADELYDLRKDPFELDNQISNPAAPLGEMRATMRRLLAETGGS